MPLLVSLLQLPLYVHDSSNTFPVIKAISTESIKFGDSVRLGESAKSGESNNLLGSKLSSSGHGDHSNNRSKSLRPVDEHAEESEEERGDAHHGGYSKSLSCSSDDILCARNAETIRNAAMAICSCASDWIDKRVILQV